MGFEINTVEIPPGARAQIGWIAGAQVGGILRREPESGR